jgi:hypothetical protein
VAETPTGPISLPLAHAETLLANCATFQSWVSAANAAAAKAHIHLAAFAPSASSDDPYAVGFHGDAGGESEVIAGGAGQTFVDRGEIGILFKAKTSEGYASDPENAELEFTNKTGAIKSEMEALSGSGTYLVLRAINWEPPMAGNDNEVGEGPYFAQIFTLHWGMEG